MLFNIFEFIYLGVYTMGINIIIRPFRMRAKVANTIATSITGIQILVSKYRFSIK